MSTVIANKQVLNSVASVAHKHALNGKERKEDEKIKILDRYHENVTTEEEAPGKDETDNGQIEDLSSV